MASHKDWQNKHIGKDSRSMKIHLISAEKNQLPNLPKPAHEDSISPQLTSCIDHKKPSSVFHYPSNNQTRHSTLRHPFLRTKTSSDSLKKPSGTTRQTNSSWFQTNLQYTHLAPPHSSVQIPRQSIPYRPSPTYWPVTYRQYRPLDNTIRS